MNRTPPELPVEPLPRDTWHRVEDRVLERLAEGDADTGGEVVPLASLRRRRAIAWAGAGVALAAAAMLWIVGPFGPSEPAPLTVQRISAGADGAAAQVGDVDVRVGAGARMTAVGDAARGFVVVLEAGRARFVVPPRGERPPFRVHAGATRVEVVGTVFEVSLADREVAEVVVEHGTVRVTDPRGTRLVRAGERVPATDRALSAEAPTTAPATGAATAPLAGPRAPRASATPRRPPAPHEEPALAAATPQTAEPIASGDASDGDEPAAEPEAAVTPAAAPAQPSRRARYERAASLEEADPDAALALYRALARSDDAWGRLALFAAGRLAHERGREAEARGLLERYLSRHPDGPNAVDARAILGR